MTLKFYTIIQPLFLDASTDGNIYEISALASFGNLIYFGCADGLLFQCVFDEAVKETTFLNISIIFSRKVAANSIRRLRVLSSAEVIAVLSADCLGLFNAESLEPFNGMPILEDVSDFSLDDVTVSNEKVAILAVCNRRNQFNVYRGRNSRFDFAFTIRLQSMGILVNCFSYGAVVATTSNYILINFSTKHISELFSWTDRNMKPLMTTVSQTEFLLLGTDSLGIFVNLVNGVSERPPIAFSSRLQSIYSADSLIFAIDDEFVSVYDIETQEQLQALLLKDASPVSCMSLDRKLIFLASSKPQSFPMIFALRQESWDFEARRLIRAGCITEALHLIDGAYRTTIMTCSAHQSTFRNARKLFNLRSRAVFTLMGFYFFELGDFEKSKKYFRRSAVDIRELLYRFVDLLPHGCSFTPNPDFVIESSFRTRPDNGTKLDAVPPSTIFDLADKLTNGGEEFNKKIRDFRVFLFELLFELRQNQIFKEDAQLLGTALVKLFVSIYEEKPQLPSSSSGFPANLEDLFSFLSSLDVDDLANFLSENAAHHSKALLFRWNGELTKALDIWRRLSLDQIEDSSFPGSDYYLNALYSLLDQPTLPSQNRNQFLPASEIFSPRNVVTCDDLVWDHFCTLLESGKFAILRKLLRHLANVSSPLKKPSHQDLAQQDLTFSVTPSTVYKKSHMLRLSHENVLAKLLPNFPELAEQYLFHTIFSNSDADPLKQELLVDLQLKLLLKYGENKSQRLVKQRSRFRRALLQLGKYPADSLLQTINSSPLSGYLVEETVILLGKLGKHRDALELLLDGNNGLSAALSYCNWRTSVLLHKQLEIAKYIWATSEDFDQDTADDLTDLVDIKKPVQSSVHERIDVWTILLHILLLRLQFVPAMHVLNELMPTLPFVDFVEILKALPEDWLLVELEPFLRNALRSTLIDNASSNTEVGLVSRLSVSSFAGIKLSQQRPLTIEANDVCYCCNIPLDAYGPGRAVAWLVEEDRAIHLHCLSSESV